ncbi:MAG: hypothetical protein HRT71_20435 [Flavobacteriales bacterium]|nr:hypothetical protein [Flavobacteriales bacterium]
MRKLFILLFLGCLLCTRISAYEATEAHFAIEQGKVITIEAEFPWTLRNALIAFDPSLETATVKSEFDAALFDYVKKTLVLYIAYGDTNKLDYIQELKNDGHAHAFKYLFTYKSASLSSLNNTLLFGQNEKQRNYHSITIDSVDRAHTTSVAYPTMKFRFKKKFDFTDWRFRIGATVILFTLAFVIIKKAKA